VALVGSGFYFESFLSMNVPLLIHMLDSHIGTCMYN